MLSVLPHLRQILGALEHDSVVCYLVNFMPCCNFLWIISMHGDLVNRTLCIEGLCNSCKSTLWNKVWVKHRLQLELFEVVIA
ncbi:uncharacterized protein PHALS_14702 [Plasmopara halstedii]|uniref:Uncharacterized protein n=1 Tax=Plasmopara halstedii TaxID=4781 RepID=A0A0P1AP56_PLAHL|nr:uncharacterized protein PHALS_14702 [Plasmopara halstedii]CEG43327.1 hypothetical protein PHALS_14702 [Plasmopara halstedii]|eukprot:XP_024579696.1 hypothetical protein PHALS_14702 [Plasmopara halstedii]